MNLFCPEATKNVGSIFTHSSFIEYSTTKPREPACTIDRDSRSDFCDRDSRSDFGVVVERANHNFLEGVPSLYL